MRYLEPPSKRIPKRFPPPPPEKRGWEFWVGLGIFLVLVIINSLVKEFSLELWMSLLVGTALVIVTIIILALILYITRRK